MSKQQTEALRRAFARALRSLRRRSGFTQERLALEGDIDRSYVSDLECARSEPGLTMLFRISDTLEIPLFDLAREIDRNYQHLMEKAK